MASYLERQARRRAGAARASLMLAMAGVPVPVGKTNDPRPLYVSRALRNAGPLRRWALGVGLPNVEPESEMHVTIAYSRAPVRWLDMGAAWTEEVHVPGGGPRTIERLGPEGRTVVLGFVSPDLTGRHEELRERGASWDWPSYLAHVTIAEDVPESFDVSALTPYTGRLIFGPEIFEAIEESGKVDKASGWQPRRRSGQWEPVGGLTAPHLGLGGVARHRFGEDARQRAFLPEPTQAELSGLPAHLDNPYGLVLRNPQPPSDPRFNADPDGIATYRFDADPGEGLSGLPFDPWDGEGMADLLGDFDEPAYPAAGQRQLGAAVAIEDPDGRVWTVTPLNYHGGVWEAFPQGVRKPGVALRLTAVREAWEETGLKVELVGFVADIERQGSIVRLYRGRRVGGSPADYGWETAAVNLVPLDLILERMNSASERAMAASLAGAPAGVVKAMLAEADLRKALGDVEDMAIWSFGSGLSIVDKAKKKAWSKQPRVPKGFPTGGQWASGAYGSGGWGAMFAAAGQPLELQKWNGEGPQAEKLNAAIAKMEHAAQTGDGIEAVMAYAAKPKAVQVYSAALWESAQEAVAFYHAKAAHAWEKAAPPAPKGEPAPPPPGTVEAPLSLAAMTKVGAKGGSNPGAIYEDVFGQHWVVKGLGTPEKAFNEIAAANAYKALGVKVPEVKAIDLGTEHGGGIGVASKVIDGLDPFKPGTPVHVMGARKDFAAHAVLANWDAVGAAYDNLKVGAGGKVYHIDPGGALLYRAQGAPKGAALKAQAVEIDTMRDPLTNPHAAKVFKGMNAGELTDSMAATLAAGWDASKGGLKPALVTAILDGYPAGHPDAQKTIDILGHRMDDLAARQQKMLASLASTSTLDIAAAGTTTGLVGHPDPKVQALANMEELAISNAIASNILAISAHNFSGASASFYEGHVNLLLAKAAAGDVDGVKAAFYNNTSPDPTKNYSTYQKLYPLIIEQAQLVAAKTAKIKAAPGEGNLATGAAKVSAHDLDAAQKLAGDATLTGKSVTEGATIAAVKAAAPKPAAEPATYVPPAMPKDPVLGSKGNKPVAKHVAIMEEIKAVAASGSHAAPAQVQALASTVKGTNTYAKALKNWAANVVEALGGQAAIDKLPKAEKAAGFQAGIAKGAEVIKTVGGYQFKETKTVAQFDPSAFPEAPDFHNFHGDGKKLYNSQPELNQINTDLASMMLSKAQANDLAGLMEMDVSKSKHLVAYKTKLIEEFDKFGKETVSTEFLGGSATGESPTKVAAEIAKSFAYSKATSYAKFEAHNILGGVPKDLVQALHDGMPGIKMTPSSKPIVAYEAASADAIESTPGLKALIKSYTGSGYDSLNNALRFEPPGSAAYEKAFTTASKLAKAALPLPDGILLSRTTSHGTFDTWKAQEGKVITEPAVVSTSIRGATGGESPVFAYNPIWIQLKPADGVKALAVIKTTSVKGENEIVLPPDTKWHVARVYRAKSAEDKGTAGELFPNAPAGKIIVEVILSAPDALPQGKVSKKWDND